MVNTAKYVIATPVCVMCGQPGEVAVSASEYLGYLAGALIQDAMPTRSADFREQIISGTHPACWDALFGDEPDDPDYCGDCGQSPCADAQDEAECEGHPDGPVMGETFYCDGTCR